MVRLNFQIKASPGVIWRFLRGISYYLPLILIQLVHDYIMYRSQHDDLRQTLVAPIYAHVTVFDIKHFRNPLDIQPEDIEPVLS